MELDLQKSIWAPVYSCTHCLRPRNSPVLPHLGSYTTALLVNQDISWQPPEYKPLPFTAEKYSSVNFEKAWSYRERTRPAIHDFCEDVTSLYHSWVGGTDHKSK
jgi:hypothetical protein